MKLERLEQLTDEYLHYMQSRVMLEVQNKEKEDLMKEYKQMVEDFIRIEPSVLEKYREDFELNLMYDQINESSDYIFNEIYGRIITVKRNLEDEKEIKPLKYTTDMEQNKGKFARQVILKDILQETFTNVERKMRQRELNIDWDSLKGYYNRIINNYIVRIDENVFERNENDKIKEEVERYVDEMEQQMREENVSFEFEEGEICPIVTDTNEFAKANQEIVNDIKQQDGVPENEQGRDKYSYGLPGDVLE